MKRLIPCLLMLASCTTAPATAENRLTLPAAAGYPERLSKTTSVTPERHSGIFTPAIRPVCGAAPLWRDDTAKYKTLTGNMQGGSSRPRVNPATQHPHRCLALPLKLLGDAHHG
jgi:hypothetical protein